MPNAKEVSEKLVGWSLQDQIEELKRKYHLRKKDSESYLDRSKMDIELNDQVIATLRHSNKAKRIMLQKESEADQRVIKDVFKDNRKERLSLQRCAAVEAMDEMNETICEKVKLLNLMRYQREMRQIKLQELREEMDRMMNLDQTKSPDCMEFENMSTQLENSLDKALIKYDTARIITQRYDDILDKLKEASKSLPARLENMENTLRAQRVELSELNELSKEAITARDTAKAELSIIEQSSYESRKQREAELNALRKEVERRKNDAEKIDKKAGRATLITDQTDQKGLLETTMKLEKQNRVLLYEDAMEKIKRASNVSDINDVVTRIESQSSTQDHLRTQVSEMESQRNRLCEEVGKMKKEYHEMKYTGGKKLSRGEALLEELTELMRKEGKHQDKLKDSLERNGKSFTTVRTGIVTLLEKLNIVKLPSPNHNYTDGDIHNQLEMCMKKINQLLKDVGADSPPGNQPAETQNNDFQDFLEMQLSPDNVRVRMEDSDTELSEFDYDGQENEVLSRNDLKNMGQRLIDSKQKLKKKKPKKKST